MNKLLRFRSFIGLPSLTVLYLSASFAHGLSHAPDQGKELNLLLLILCDIAVALSVAALLGFIWAVFAPRWLSGLFRLIWRDFKYVLYTFYAALAAAGIYAVFLRVFQR